MHTPYATHAVRLAGRTYREHGLDVALQTMREHLEGRGHSPLTAADLAKFYLAAVGAYSQV